MFSIIPLAAGATAANAPATLDQTGLAGTAVAPGRRQTERTAAQVAAQDFRVAVPDLAAALVREWLRMQVHPGVIFVAAVTGERRAALSAGPQVWMVAEAWQQHDKDDRTAAVVADALGLSAIDVETALAYWADYQDEVDELISRHHASQDEALAAWERRQALDAI